MRGVSVVVESLTRLSCFVPIDAVVDYACIRSTHQRLELLKSMDLFFRLLPFSISQFCTPQTWRPIRLEGSAVRPAYKKLVPTFLRLQKSPRDVQELHGRGRADIREEEENLICRIGYATDGNPCQSLPPPPPPARRNMWQLVVSTVPRSLLMSRHSDIASQLFFFLSLSRRTMESGHRR